jgi:translation initiation factor IF-1
MIVMMLLGASCFAVIISNISALVSGMGSKESVAMHNCDAVILSPAPFDSSRERVRTCLSVYTCLL